ncbi:MAG: hypothetical protein Q9225_004433 [Loekoesia sp. 1 TL-2023]
MLVTQFSRGFVRFIHVTLDDMPLAATVGLGFGFALLIWRLLRFSVLPLYFRNDPQEYPHWLPGVGHLFSFFRNSDKLLERGRIYCGNTREPFAISIAGSRLYVLTKASDVAEAYSNIKTLSFNVFVQEMLKTMGNSSFCIEQMYKPPSTEKAGFPNPHRKPLATLARDMHLQQLYPGKYLDILSHEFDKRFDCYLQAENLRDCDYARASGHDSVVLPLMVWCSDVFTRAGQGAYFGPLLEEIDPQMTWKFLEFDDLSYQIQFQYPKWLSRKMHKAKGAMIESLIVYFETPQEKRHGDAWFVKAMENEMRALKLNTYDIALLMLTEYWGVNTNTRKAAFWMLVYVLHDPDLYDTLVDEIQPAFTKDAKTPNTRYLVEDCIHLNAAWDETIRMSAFSASVRHVIEDTVIGGKILRKGSRLMIPYRQLHFDASVFGSDIQSFKRDRFLKNKTLTRGGSWRPYGGGTTQCPGRFAAKQVVLSFVAILLRRFHVQVNGPQQFPEGQLGKPVLGIMASKGEIEVRITPRKA